MKSLIVALFLCLALISPAGSYSDKPFLAVFCQPEFIQEWKLIKPDLLMESRNWEDVKLFITQIERLSGDAPVIIDFDTHGATCGHLYLCTENRKGAEATFGYILNQVDRLPEGKVMRVESEACYAGNIYHRTMKGVKPFEKDGTVFENYKGDIPLYPVYGAGRISNFANSIHGQLEMGQKVEIHDLREYTDRSPGKMIRHSKDEAAIWLFYQFYLSHQILMQMLDGEATKINAPYY